MENQLNSIACELCRTKKCKCDRKIPTCSSCSSIGATCQYPQSNKRGIPSGYIASLEERLIETEIALLKALSFINIHFHQVNDTHVDPSQYHDAFTNYSTSLSKQAKVDEWKRLPLMFEDQQKAWLQEKAHVASRSDYRNDSIGGSPESQGTEHPWPESPLPPLARHNEAQFVPRRQSLIGSQNAPDNQGLIHAGYQPVTHDNESLQVSCNYTSATHETPKTFPTVDTWGNIPTQQHMGEAQIAAGEAEERVYDSHIRAPNLQFLDDPQHSPGLQTATEQVPMGLKVPSPSHSQQSSISSELIRHSLEAKKISSKQWQRYF